MQRDFPLLLRRLLSAFLCWLSLLAHAEATPAAAWLERMAQSMSELNYRGVLSYSREGHFESLRVTHGRLDGELVERLEYLDGARREIIRRGEQVTCVQLDQRFNRLFDRRLLREGLSGLNDYYRISLLAEDRVAGRPAVAIAIEPRDALRYGYRFALDRASGLLLRSEVLDASGKVLERMQFVDIEIGQPLQREWLAGAAAPAAAKPASPAAIGRVVEEMQMPWRPQWLPPGFMLAVAPHRPSEDVLTYSDGLAVLSVFVETGGAALPANAGKAMQGATVAYTRTARFGDSPALVTVVGEVPAATASRVAESVIWDGGN